MSKATELDELAKEMIGDGGTPNLFFVSSLGRGRLTCTAIFREGRDASRFYSETNADAIEDRSNGEVEFSSRLRSVLDR